AAGIADAVGRHLHHVLEKGDAPAHRRGQKPRQVSHVLQVGIPGEGHEDVGENEQAGSLNDDGHDESFQARGHSLAERIVTAKWAGVSTALRFAHASRYQELARVLASWLLRARNASYPMISHAASWASSAVSHHARAVGCGVLRDMIRFITSGL